MNVLAINAMLEALLSYLGTGATFEVYSGTKPAAGGAETTLIAIATLADPEGTITDGVLTFEQADPEGDMAIATGVPTWGRLKTSTGVWVIDFTVSGASGSGQVKVSVIDPPIGDPEAKVYAGGKFFIGTVTLG